MQNAMEKLFSEVKGFTEGMLVKGRIIEVRPNEVLVDIGYKSEGAFRSRNLRSPMR
jgi:small subunit ribosomal protein S1